MAISGNGKCSITSPSPGNLARKLLNAIIIIVPTIAPLLSTENGKKKNRDSSRVLIAEPTIKPMISEHTVEPTITEPTTHLTITEPTIESMIEPRIALTNYPASSGLSASLTTKTKSSRKSLKIPDSRLWRRGLAFEKSTAM